MAGHCWPMPLQETLKHSQVGLAQFPVEVLFLFPGPWCAQGFVCTLKEWVSFPQVLWRSVLLQLLLCPWMCGILFWWVRRLPFNGCSTASCSFSALAGEDVHRSFYSTILNQSPLQKIPINAKYLPLLAKHSNYRTLGMYSLTFQVVCSLSQ